jgi:hypothetical protein
MEVDFMYTFIFVCPENISSELMLSCCKYLFILYIVYIFIHACLRSLRACVRVCMKLLYYLCLPIYTREIHCITLFCPSVRLSVRPAVTLLLEQLLHFYTDLDDTWHKARWLHVHEVRKFRFVNFCNSYGHLHVDIFTTFYC